MKPLLNQQCNNSLRMEVRFCDFPTSFCDQMSFGFRSLLSPRCRPDKQMEPPSKQSLMHHGERTLETHILFY